MGISSEIIFLLIVSVDERSPHYISIHPVIIIPGRPVMQLFLLPEAGITGRRGAGASGGRRPEGPQWGPRPPLGPDQALDTH